jgi:hypothetical protein
VFFAKVLALSAQLGMSRLGVVALDGVKIPASALKSANQTEETLARLAAETVARHGETDAVLGRAGGRGRARDASLAQLADLRSPDQMAFESCPEADNWPEEPGEYLESPRLCDRDAG